MYISDTSVYLYSFFLFYYFLIWNSVFHNIFTKMKIRTVAIGLVLDPIDFKDDCLGIIRKLSEAKLCLDAVCLALTERTGHEVQTMRVYTNSFEEWLLPLLSPPFTYTLEKAVSLIDSALTTAGIQMCSIGSCDTYEAIALVPKILAFSNLLSCSVLFSKNDGVDICPNYEKCVAAASVCLELARKCGDLGNFRFCSSFNCEEGTPFFPAAFRTRKGDASDEAPMLTLGLENGDMLFLAFHGAGVSEPAETNCNPHSKGRSNLHDLMRQICLPIQHVAMKVCQERGIIYGGIDASLNPGLALPDSVGAGLESLLSASTGACIGDSTEEAPLRQFGAMGTLAAVSTVTSAVKALALPSTKNNNITFAEDTVKLVGYSGLMLPVMEDTVLAQRATEGRFTLRDLLMFSAVCGVGLDTVPIPGNTSVAALAGVYMEVAALAFRLNKPLSCRVLPQQGKLAGDTTEVVSPYLCNSTVFPLS